MFHFSELFQKCLNALMWSKGLRHFYSIEYLQYWNFMKRYGLKVVILDRLSRNMRYNLKDCRLGISALLVPQDCQKIQCFRKKICFKIDMFSLLVHVSSLKQNTCEILTLLLKMCAILNSSLFLPNGAKAVKGS